MSRLYLVPTPIGNLEDMTFRAVRVLREADLILAEDTRKSGILLKHYEIKNKLRSHHQHNEHQTAVDICTNIERGQVTALITDAGTPGISDPGFLLVRECIARGIEVQTLPGPTALIPALVNSGIPCDRYCFEGFLPHKKGRSRKLEELKKETRTLVLYESPYRLQKTLEQLAEALGAGRKASVSREISKMHEETRRGSLKELASWYAKHKPRGEFVLVVEGI